MDIKASKQPNHRLSKTVNEKSPISFSSNILNTQTNEVWLAKVFDLQKVDSYGMLDVLEYNQEVFHFLKNNYDNSIYMERCFVKNDKDYLVFQPWNIRLSDYLKQNPNGIKNKQEVKNILQEVLLSLCDIYAEDFMVLNLKPQNIVRVSSPNEGQLGWRIQSLVFQYQSHNLPMKCEYQFDYDWASNEEKNQRQNLDDDLKDEQIVWYMGVLALRLVYGSKFKLNKNFKDSDLDLNQIKKNCLPEVYQLIQKSVKANLKDRIPLKSFLQLKVFSNVEISTDLKQKFRSGHQNRIKKSVFMKSSVLKKSSLRQNQLKISIARKVQLSKTGKISVPQTKKTAQNGSISETKAKKMFHQFRWILEKCFYLAQIKKYTQSAASIDDSNIQDKTVIRYVYFKLAQINLTWFLNIIQKSPELQTFRQSQTSKGYYQNLLDSIQQNSKQEGKKPIIEEAIQYEKKMRILDPKKLNLISNLESLVCKLKKNIENSKVNLQDLSETYILINGIFFSSLKKYFENNEPSKIQNRGIKVRALCFFIFSTYLLQINPKSQNSQNAIKQLLQVDFQKYQREYIDDGKILGSNHVKFADDVQFIKLCEYTNQAQESTLIANSQNILSKYFKTINTQQKDWNKGASIKNQFGKRTSLLTVPNRSIF